MHVPFRGRFLTVWHMNMCLALLCHPEGIAAACRPAHVCASTSARRKHWSGTDTAELQAWRRQIQTPTVMENRNRSASEPQRKTTTISHKQHRYICSNSQQYIVWVKIIIFSFMPKIIRILRSCSMKIFSKCPTLNILIIILTTLNILYYINV